MIIHRIVDFIQRCIAIVFTYTILCCILHNITKNKYLINGLCVVIIPKWGFDLHKGHCVKIVHKDFLKHLSTITLDAQLIPDKFIDDNQKISN